MTSDRKAAPICRGAAFLLSRQRWEPRPAERVDSWLPIARPNYGPGENPTGLAALSSCKSWGRFSQAPQICSLVADAAPALQ
jgi:hypothetical protein